MNCSFVLIFSIKFKESMSKFICLIVITFLIFSCNNGGKGSNTKGKERIAELENELSQIKLDNESKDKMIKESLLFFNEVQSNLETIQLKKDEIRLKSESPDLTEEDKTFIIEQIKHINFLREENGRKINQLNNALKASNVKIIELENLIERLMKEIELKDQQLEILQAELESVNKEYSKLFDAYMEQTLIVSELTDQINTGFYTYGTQKELTENKVIEKRDGFIGIGKKTALVDNFNEEYFIKIDILKKKEIYVEGTKVKLVTDHPSSSYEIAKDEKNSKIIIKNPKEFWKVSKYLVVIVG
jgi:hypothetical protein